MVAALGSSVAMNAEIITTQPAILQTNSTDIVITYHADEGNKALMGLAETEKVYAHTGVITSASTTDSDWKHAPTWLTNTEKYEMTYAGTNTYTLNIGEIATYYGITDPDEVVKKLAFVFRNATGTKQGKTASGGDIFVTVNQPGFDATLTANSSSTVVKSGDNVTISLNSTQSADLTLYLNSTSSTPLKQLSSATTLSYDYSFTAAGDYKFIGVAKSGDETKTVELDMVCISGAQAENYPGGTPLMGARIQSDGSVLFCIAAPQKESAVIIGSWNNYGTNSENVMKYQDYNGQRYFWTRISGLADHTDYLYYYLIDGTTGVGDPYAHLILDPNYDSYIDSSVFPNMPAYPSDYVSGVPLAIFNKNLDDYNWQVTDFNAPEQSNLVIYELLFRDFTGTEGQAKGNGTVRQAIEKLDYLKNLGVNAVELLPIMEFNGNLSWGYNTNFYMAPDKTYGTPDDYKEFIDACHQRGMAVILDIVFNQSDWLHPWYQMYPISSNPFYNATSPHSYSVLNDWNQDNEIVQQQWYDALAYWMTAYKVDGFRFDLVKGLGDNDSYGATYNSSNNTWTGGSDSGTNRYNQTRVDRMKKIHEQMRKVNPNAYFINELLGEASEEIAMATDGEAGWANVNNNSCQFAMGYASDASLVRFYSPKDSNRTWGSTISYAESHDEERMAYKQTQWGATGVKGDTQMSMRRLGSVAAQMLMCPGSHMIWQFQELGADQTTKDSSGSNNTGNKKVIWSYLDDPDRAGLMQNYAELNHIRNHNPQLFTESASTTVNLVTTIATREIKLTNGSSSLNVIINPSVTEEFYATVANASDLQILSKSYGTEVTISGNVVTVAPGAYVVFGSKDLVGVESLTTDANLPAVSVYGVSGGIRIAGDYKVAKAYTLTGAACGLNDLIPGLYVVVVDGQSYKVMVR